MTFANLPMDIRFGTAYPPRIIQPQNVALNIVIGFVLILTLGFLLDKFGTILFRRGFAKPFYIRGHRIHHKTCLYFIIPSCYLALCALLFLGYIEIIWPSIWVRVSYIFLVVLACVAVDIVGDRHWPKIRKSAILHHEWIYGLILAYIFMYVVNVVI